MRKLIAFLILSVGCLAQVTTNRADNLRRYTASYTATLASTAFVSTVARGSNIKDRVYIEAVEIVLPEASTISIELGGTRPTVVTNEVCKSNTIIDHTSSFWGASNAGVGNVIRTIPIIANVITKIPLKGTVLQYGGADQITIRSGTVSGTAYITYKWGERQ